MTDLQRIFPVVIFVALIIAGSIAAGCTESSTHPGAFAPLSPARTNNTVEKIEVYHFHGTTQCTSCIAVGDLAEKTVNDNFKAELASGRLVFAHVNYDLPENAALAAKYGVTGSSLWIGIYDNNGFHKQQDMDVWYLTGEKEKYNFYLTALISKRLNGDLS